MKKNYSSKKVLQACLLFFMIITTNMFAQVGIGTTTPNASSILDLSSSTQGLLAPRMTTAQRIAIVSPADGLMVYDTDLKSFFHFDTAISSWDKLNSDANNGRVKFKRIKSTDILATVLATEKAAGGGSKYLLDTGTLYEINGTINLDFPIELNNAYISGQDSGEDKLVKTSGDLFEGTTGGSIRVITLTASAGKVFNIAGGGTQNLVFRDAIVAGSSNVGVIDNFSLVFISIVQFVGNTSTGIIYKDISKLLINNTGWFSNNGGSYETLQGTFGSVQKQGGFSEVNGTAIGFDVSSNPVITGDAVMEAVVFTGNTTAGYVKPYTGGYTGYNFNNSWSVRCAGIPNEGDSFATGDVNFDYPVGLGASTNFSGTNVKTKFAGTTTSNNLFRFSRDTQNNRLKYLGKKKRYFTVNGALSFQSSADNTTYIIYIAKNGTVVNQSKVYVRSNSVNDILASPLAATVELSTNDYVEVWAERFAGNGDMLTVSLNLIVD